MKSQNLTIDIPSPCSQDPTIMPQVGNGLFCSACEKVVMDFSKMSEGELISFIAYNSKKGFCGKFDEKQLRKKYSIPQASNRKPSRFSWLIVVMLSLKLEAQNNAPLVKKTEASVEKQVVETGKWIKGRIFNRETKMGVAVSIKIFPGLDTNVLVNTFYSEMDGGYNVFIPDSLRNRFVTLIISGVNYEERKVVVDRTKLPSFLPVSILPVVTIDVVAAAYNPAEIITSISERHYMGIPALDYSIYEKPSFFKRLKNSVRRLFNRIIDHR